MRVVLNPFLDVTPDREGLRFTNRLSGASVVASALQASLLPALFQDAAELDDAATRIPHARPHQGFFDRCAETGVLLPVDDDGHPLLPTRVMPESRFLQAPAFEHLEAGGGDGAVVFLGVPWDRDVSGRAGARFGPSSVRGASQGAAISVDVHTRRPQGFFDLGLQQKILEGVDVFDAGDVLSLPGDPVDVVRARMRQSAADICQQGAVPLVVGGDHSITRPVLAGVIDALEANGDTETPITIFHLDAHTDLGDALPGEGGRLHLHHGNVMTVVLEELRRVKGLVQVGLRGVLKYAHHVVDDRVVAFGVDALDDADVGGLGGLIQRALDAVPEDHLVWVSLDIDVVDPAFAAATGTPVAGGLTPRELWRLVDAVASNRACLGMDLVEVAEPLGPHDSTAGIAVTCLLRFCRAMVEAQRAADGAPTSES